MSNLKTFSDPFIQLPLKIKFDLENEEENELERLLMIKTLNELKKIKEQSIKKTILFKLLSTHNLKSDILEKITNHPNLLFGHGSVVEYQNKYSLLEYQLMEKLNFSSYKSSTSIIDDAENLDEGEDWGIDEDLDLDLDIDLNDIPGLKEDNEKQAKISNGINTNAEKADLYALKKKLFTNNSDENRILTPEQENEIEEKSHEEMINELASLTNSLKNSTVAFQTQLDNSDKDIINKTETNLLSNGERLQMLGKKLGTFSKSKLGLFFYMMSILVMILGLFITYLIIKIFPEM
ncbi:uncharacterized protein HGUI_01463 [Hanseniaspora guilliermondii]|uniref:Uncharacterized protein n=1 Tax=Hanseniaspora guilliermondii TaxID=56406 RepID=A0A1L0CWQ2_9ASCO|nr:uncharacterized protein HGUI_01463 [Hanseniaspora guilliermondii]